MNRNSPLMMRQVLFSIGNYRFLRLHTNSLSTETVLFKFKINGMFVFDFQLMNNSHAFICIRIWIDKRPINKEGKIESNTLKAG